MDIAPPTPDPGSVAVKYDRSRINYAVFSAVVLLVGIWLVWLGSWLLGWSMNDLGIHPRHLRGLVGILSAPLAHASFEHLMSNTLPLALLATLTLYAYPRATQWALPMIWLLSGLGVWLFARDSVHVGMSGINHGLMFFLFFTGLLRRDRLGVAIAMVVFFFYGGMLLTVLPREEHISFEYHLAGAVAGAGQLRVGGAVGREERVTPHRIGEESHDGVATFEVKCAPAPLPHHVLTQGVGHQVPVLGIDAAEVAVLQLLQLPPGRLVEHRSVHAASPS